MHRQYDYVKQGRSNYLLNRPFVNYSLPTIAFNRNITLRLRIEHVFSEHTIHFKWKKVLNVTLRLIKVLYEKFIKFQ